MNSKPKSRTLPITALQNHSGGGVTSTVADEKGIVLIAAIGLIAILSLIGAIGIITTTTEVKISGNYKTNTQAFYAAEGGAEYGIQKLREKLKSKLNPTTSDVSDIESDFNSNPPLSGYTFAPITITQGTDTPTLEPITQGNYAGLTALTNTYEITSEAGTSTATAKVVMSVEDYLIPLFQFGVFYQDDLEIHPGPEMTFSGGKIHSNSNIYLGANNKLSINSQTTSAGDIFYYRKTTGLEQNENGTVQFKDGDGNYQAVKQDDDGDGIKEAEEILDKRRADWASESINRWDGNVKSKDHGIFEIELVPLPETSTPLDVIKRGDTFDPGSSLESEDLHFARYYWKAGLRIVDGTAYDINGVELDLTNVGDEPNPISNETFWDEREGQNITVTTVDMDQLRTNTVATAALNNATEPGVLYISESSSNKGVRLANGAVIPAGGLTVASDNPIYIQGDYNSANLPAAVAADAVTILSNAWDDDNSNSDLDDFRIATPTTVNAAIMTGNVPTDTDNSQYSGGLENFPRFLEKWSGITFTYSGSLVSLWQSQQADGNWKYGYNGSAKGVYKAPIRNWSYGLGINNMPPGTPYVRLIQKVRWYHDIN